MASINYWVKCFILSLFLFPPALLAQRLPKPQALTIEDGLGFRNVTAVTQDSRGLMWFGTSQGIERYDGHKFVKYGNDPLANIAFPGENILIEGLLNINDSTIWVVADGQLYALNIHTHVWKNLSALKGLQGKITGVHQTQKAVAWLITCTEEHQFLYRCDLGVRAQPEQVQFQQIARAKFFRMPFYSLAEDLKGNIWWSNNVDGLRLFNPQGELLHAVKPDSFVWFGTKMYNTPVFVDSQNRIFIMPKSCHEIWQYHPENGSHDILVDSLPSPVYHTLEDSRGNVWFSYKGGLLRLGNEPGKPLAITDFTGLLKDVLQFSNIFDLYEDHTHVLWIATDNGLLRFPIGKQSFQNWLTVPGLPWGNAMRGMFSDNQGYVYAFCEIGNTGLHRIEPESGKTRIEFQIDDKVTDSRKLESGINSFFYNSSGNFAWCLSSNLIKIDLNQKTTSVAHHFENISAKFESNPFLVLKDQSILLGSKMENLTVYHPQTDHNTRFLAEGLNLPTSTNTTVLKEDKNGHIWVGTVGEGLFCFNRQGMQLAHFSTKTQPVLSKNHVLSLLFDNAGNLWVGTFGGGLNHLSGDLAGFTNVSNQIFTQNEGLCDNNVVSILEDDQGNIWAATYNGLSSYQVREHAFRNFFEEDGLSNNEFNYTAALKDAEGRLWFGGMNGINTFSPQDILQSEKNPPLCLTGFSSYNQKLGKEETQIIGRQSINRFVISPEVGWFQFNWALPNYFKPDKNHYYVWLEGLEEGWSHLGSTPFVRYNKLPPGHYTLRIKGSDSKGNWSAQELAIPITVLPFFYQTWWFLLLILALVAGIVFVISRYRIQQLLEMERMRTRIASDLHDEVGSMLSGLAMQTDLLEMNAPDKDRSRIEHIGNISRSAVSKMRDMVWSIDSRRDKLKNLLERMQEQASELLQPRDISCRFELGELPLEKKLPVDIRQHIFLIFKEALNNAARHANATAVVVRFGNFDGQFVLSIQDNGRSTPQQHNRVITGLGLSNMQMRAKKLGAQLDIVQNDGFLVQLTMRAI
jgi:ligand-binding sensor domain-containing protein/two-component sensor histidine kinase